MPGSPRIHRAYFGEFDQVLIRQGARLITTDRSRLKSTFRSTFVFHSKVVGYNILSLVYGN